MDCGTVKICAGASSGGHMNELLALLDHAQAWHCQPACYITTLEVLVSKLRDRGRVYVVGECNRMRPFHALMTMARCLGIAWRERPDVVITTGSMPLAFFCLAAKLLGARIVWIDSIANCERFSLSGSLVKPFADLFLTQWPELAQKDTKAEFAGAIL